MKLFIAEKPSVAKAIAAELGVSGRGDGFINCRNDVVVTWCFGHLLEQAEPDAYLPDDIPKTKKGRKIWRMQDLPIFPQHWLMEAKTERGAKKQLSVIGKLLKSAATVVNAGDPDREGQLLVDEVLEHFRARQPVERFWVSAVDPASIRKGLAKLGDNRSYAGMRDAARGRSRADWLLGMNLSRAYTLAGGDGLLAVGRVQTPTLFMVARRDYVVRNFTPVPYLSITADLAKETVPFTARWKPGPDQKGLDEEGRLLIDLDVGRALVERLSKEKTATVLSAETKRRKANPPKAYSLADIQIEASKRFGMTAENTLKVCQSLYEVRKITSYPRTDCGYLPESQHADAPAVLAAVARNFPAAAPACAKADPKLKSPTFNDKKVTAHHGIVPVANTIDPATLTREEADIYRLIVRRYIAQFFPVHEFDATEVVLGIGGETFTAKGRVVRVEGWRILFEKDRRAAEEKRRKNPKAAGGRDPDGEDEDDAQTLPALKKGDVCDVRAVKGREDKTKPPQFFTEGTLIAAMENIWRSFDDPKGQAMLKEAGGIGTPATRAAIIAELRRKEYLETEGKYLHCTESGRRLLKRVSPRIRSAAMTAHFEERLRLVESGAEQLDNFVSEYEAFIAAELQKVRAGRTAPSGSARTVPRAVARSARPEHARRAATARYGLLIVRKTRAALKRRRLRLPPSKRREAEPFASGWILAGRRPASELLNELGLELHRAEAVDPAVDVVVAFDEADVLHLGADLERRRGTLHLEGLHDGDGVAVGEQRAVGVLHDEFLLVMGGFLAGRPFMGAFRADEMASILVHVLGAALRARRKRGHGGVLELLFLLGF